MGDRSGIRIAAAALALASTLALAGCGDGEKVTLHKPGVYKGKEDPLMALQATPEQQEALRQRLRNQMDR